MRTIELGATGEKISSIGQGAWGIKTWGSQEHYEQWKRSLRRGIELGMTHIDTAEVYGWGKSEKVVGDVIHEYPRDDLFITSKLFFTHLTYRGMKKAAYKSLERLDIAYVDLYLIHFPVFFISIEKQMRVLEELVDEGKTRYIGVSNFSVEQFREAQCALTKEELVTNQLRANVTEQTHLHESLPYYQKEDVTLTAYSPLGHNGLSGLNGKIRENLERIADAHDATIQQIAIAWLINHENVITIPKAFHVEHVEANAAAADITLSRKEMELLNTVST